MLSPTPRANRPNVGGVSNPTLQSLFAAEEGSLLRYAFSLTGRRAVAEEIVQEVFLQLHVQWDDIDAPRAWLMRSVRNRAFSYLRDNKREVLRGDEVKSPVLYTENETPDQLLLRMEATGFLRQILLELDASDRELVRLKYFENLKYSDISHRTGLSVGNVGYRLHHILKQLAGKLRQRGVDGKA